MRKASQDAALEKINKARRHPQNLQSSAARVVINENAMERWKEMTPRQRGELVEQALDNPKA